MPPEAYFPGALDDSMAVYKEVIGKTDPKRVGLIGTSAGGALVLEMGLRAKQLGLPMPGAIASGTPMSDSTKTGDSFYTNAMLDNVLVSTEGFCDAAAAFYAKGHDLKDPLISPIYGDMSGFPPTILTSGTRRPAAQQHGARASQASQPRHRFVPAGLRGPVARALHPRRHRARDEGGVRRDRQLLRQASRPIVLARALALSPNR